MPKIDWNVPKEIEDHINRRIRERNITEDDFRKLWKWRKQTHYAPKGDWFKDFGSFKLAGHGKHPLTVLSKSQRGYGEEL